MEAEGFGIVFVEAGACGVPVVAGRSGGSHEAVVDGETGFLFESDLVAAVKRALAAYADAARWREIQRRGMQRDFSWAGPARRYAALYSQTAAMRRAALIGKTPS